MARYIKSDYFDYEEYLDCISDLISHPLVRSMRNFRQHGNTDCLEHCLNVSYSAYLMCKRMGWDYRSAARGGLLHDFFLYDWRKENMSAGMHGFNHPAAALKNACAIFNLNECEKNIILRHMWPLTLTLPAYKEAYTITTADKYCAIMETLAFGKQKHIVKLKTMLDCWPAWSP